MGSSVWFEGSVRSSLPPRQEGTTSETKKSRPARPCQRRSGPALHRPRSHLLQRPRVVPSLSPRSAVLGAAAPSSAALRSERRFLVGGTGPAADRDDGRRGSSPATR